MVATASRPDSRLVVHHSQKKEPTLKTRPSTRAFRGGTASRASGRRAVRFITLSISASATQLSVLAPPAAIIPPISVLRINSGFTRPRTLNAFTPRGRSSAQLLLHTMVDSMPTAAAPQGLFKDFFVGSRD